MTEVESSDKLMIGLVAVLFLGSSLISYLVPDPVIRSLVGIPFFFGFVLAMVLLEFLAQLRARETPHLTLYLRYPDTGAAERKDLYLLQPVFHGKLELDTTHPYIYWQPLRKPISVDFGPGVGRQKCHEIQVALRRPYEENFLFRPRKRAALWEGFAVDHPLSDVCEGDLFPIPIMHPETKKPVPRVFIDRTGVDALERMDPFRTLLPKIIKQVERRVKPQ